jgi:hypothetical protein
VTKTKMAIDDKIVQIVPAMGWFARYDDPNDPSGYVDAALTCWALVETPEGERQVVGLDGGDYISVADELNGFRCYIHESELAKQHFI